MHMVKYYFVLKRNKELKHATIMHGCQKYETKLKKKETKTTYYMIPSR